MPISVDYLESELHSPTDSSEDSVEVKISPISVRNKRKSIEPRKVPDVGFSGPLKKRMCLKVKAESAESHPFRPWSPKGSAVFAVPSPPPATSSYFRPPSPPVIDDDQPVSLVTKKRDVTTAAAAAASPSVTVKCEDIPRVPVHPLSLSAAETERVILNSAEAFPSLHCSSRREQRNYKNMTRERRIEANARERTRVHTISAAFDTLRRSIPAYSHNQKLSKLSVLRIACSYIMTLSNIVSGDDVATAECVDLVTKTIQREGKLRKKKDDND